jgi:hypothetical protein
MSDASPSSFGGKRPSDRVELRSRIRVDVGVLVVSLIAVVAIYAFEVLPLSEPPAGPPAGSDMAWAGPALQGYAQQVSVYVATCGDPVSVVLSLFPASRLSLARDSTREISFAVVGNKRVPLTIPRIYEGAQNTDIIEPLLSGNARALPRPVRLVAAERAGNVGAFAFRLDPRTPYVYAEFRARWTSTRGSDGSCWIDVPAQLGRGENQASEPANAILGHTYDWTREPIGFPLVHSNVTIYGSRLNGGLTVDVGASMPYPSSTDPPTWNCAYSPTANPDCEVFAVLARPGNDAVETRSLIIWSLLAGLGLAVLGGALLEAIQNVVRLRGLPATKSPDKEA